MSPCLPATKYTELPPPPSWGRHMFFDITMLSFVVNTIAGRGDALSKVNVVVSNIKIDVNLFPSNVPVRDILGIILKLWMSVSLCFMFSDRYRFEFQIPRNRENILSFSQDKETYTYWTLEKFRNQ